MTAQQTFRNMLVVIGTLVAAYAIFLSWRILVVLLVAIIVASALRPAVLTLKKARVPEGIAILLTYLTLALAILVIAYIVLPPAIRNFAGYFGDDSALTTSVTKLEVQLQEFITAHGGSQLPLPSEKEILKNIGQIRDDISASIPAMAGEFGSVLSDLVLAVVMGVYWLTARDQAIGFVLQLFPIGRREVWGTIFTEIETSMGAYVRGIGLVCLFVGVANFAILSLLQVPNAITLGFIVGITTAIPIVGGYLGAVTAVILALLSSPLHALFALLSFVGVQQIENHYLTPRVMSRSVGLNPILIIVFLVAGATVGGVVGALLAIPLAGALFIIVRHLFIQPRQQSTEPQRVEGGLLLDVKPLNPVPDARQAAIITDPRG